MVERVAQAILKEERNLDFELASDLTKQSYCRYARAAIEAMIDAGDRTDHDVEHDRSSCR